MSYLCQSEMALFAVRSQPGLVSPHLLWDLASPWSGQQNLCRSQGTCPSPPACLWASAQMEELMRGG